MIARWSVICAVLLVNAPVLWAALAEQTVPVSAALVRLLITAPVAGLLLAGLRAATRKNETAGDRRR